MAGTLGFDGLLDGAVGFAVRDGVLHGLAGDEAPEPLEGTEQNHAGAQDGREGDFPFVFQGLQALQRQDGQHQEQRENTDTHIAVEAGELRRLDFAEL